MAGRRHKDFRSGDLNEELGMLLLKGIAAVARVPRPEDIGIDAVATLLREGPNDALIAEDSFYVQFKSSTVRRVRFLGHEVRWLESLKLPFFIGSVRKADSAIDLYATHRLSRALLGTRYEEVELVVDPTNEVFEGIDPETEVVAEQYRRVNIGPPLLTWSTGDLSESEFVGQSYAILKPYLETEQRNIDYRGIRYIEKISWKTGEPPNCVQGSIAYQYFGSDEDILQVFRSMVPHMEALRLRAMGTKDRSLIELLMHLVRYMRSSGFDPDPSGLYDSTYQHWDQLAFPSGVSDQSS